MRTARWFLGGFVGAWLVMLACVPPPAPEAKRSAFAAAVTGASFYASPTGSGVACTLAAPCDYKTAIDATKSPVKPCDTLYLRGGTYVGQFIATLVGTDACPVKIAQYPGEKAKIDGYHTTTLASAITSTANTLTLTAGLYPQGATINVESERVNLWASGSNNGTYVGVERGWDGTAKVAHSAGALVWASGAAMTLAGSHTWFGFDIEVTSSYPLRVYPMAGSNPTMRGPYGVAISGDHNRVINAYVHDTTEGIATSSGVQGKQVETHGNIVKTTGWNGPPLDRGHGHACYVQCSPGNGPFNSGSDVYLDSADINMQAYTGGEAIGDVHFNQTISARAGILWGSETYGLLFGTPGAVMTASGLTNSCVYQDVTGTGVSVGYSAGTSNFVLTGNYAASSYGAINTAGSTAGLVATGNTLVGTTNLPIAGNTVIPWKPTSGIKQCTMPNSYEAGRANIAIYNWAKTATIPVDLSSVLAAGDQYVLMNAYNFTGPPIASGTYAGGSITVSASGHPQAAIIGLPTPKEPGPEFNVFVVRKTAGGAPFPTSTPIATATVPPMPTSTLTAQPTASASPTVTPSPSAPPSSTPTTTKSPLPTSIPPTATTTKSPVPTLTKTPLPPTATKTLPPTATKTAVPTWTKTKTPVPSKTPSKTKTPASICVTPTPNCVMVTVTPSGP